MPDETKPTFHEIHVRGAEEFGNGWYTANSEAVQHAREAGLDPTKPKIGRAISLIVLRAMYHGRNARFRKKDQGGSYWDLFGMPRKAVRRGK